MRQRSEQPTGTTDQTDQRDVERSSDVDSNKDLTPVDVTTPTVSSQDHDISPWCLVLPHRRLVVRIMILVHGA